MQLQGSISNMSFNNPNIDPELARRRRSFAQRRSLSEYGVSLPDQPEDLSCVHPSDDRYNFFSKGRDFQPRKAKHRFTDEELRTLETFESSAVLPSCSEVYRHWLQKSGMGTDSWLTIGIIAVIVGILASVMKLVVEKCQIFYLPFISNLIETGKYVHLALYYPLLGCAFSIMSAITVVIFCPCAAGSGLPEIIGILNGCVVRNVLNFRTLVCKMISCICTVISTLPVGFEGPMVHIGALVGACMAQPFRCRHVKRNKKSQDDEEEATTACCPTFCRYRDCKERHSLICVGAAAGVAAAFSSPIAGLTFAMEEMSSHWSKTLTWQAFVCCILARGTAELLHGLFIALESIDHGSETTHLFHLSESALFDMRKMLSLNVAIFIPAAFLGIVGGILGSIFIFVLLKISKFRRKTLAKINNPKIANLVKIWEVILVSVLSSAAVLMILSCATCKTATYSQVLHDDNTHSARFFRLRSFRCETHLNVSSRHHQVRQKGEFNEGASLLFGSWEQMIRNLFSRRTAGYFDTPILLYIFVFFWVFSSWTSITSIASGLLIPQLAIGALLGRLLGQFIHDVCQIPENSDEWDWIDPGALALLGAASFLSGTSRLPVTSVVMMVEMTNDVNISLLIMLCVMLSKFSGDLMTHSLYHSMLDFKCIPYLESELKIYNEGKRINLELFKVEDIMKGPVHCVGVKENIYTLANLLLDTNHGGFPVVQVGNGFHRTFLGILTRLELTILLTKTKKFDARELVGEDMDRIRISYPEYSSGKLKDLETVNNVLHNYSTTLKYRNVYVNLLPYINTSAISVPKDFSLYRAYMMFRFLGLRHMVIVDRLNQVEGILTRKDLLGYKVETKLKFVLNNNTNKKGFYIGSPSGSDTSSSGSSFSPGSTSTIYEVISRVETLTTPPKGLQTTVIPEEDEEEEED